MGDERSHRKIPKGSFFQQRFLGEEKMITNVLTKEQYKALSRKIINSIERNCKIVPVNTLKHAHYKLRQPVYITIEIEENSTIASLDDIEAFAYSDTEFEAVNQLCEEIIQLYDDLRNSDEKLGILPQKWLMYLNEIIEIK